MTTQLVIGLVILICLMGIGRFIYRAGKRKGEKDYGEKLINAEAKTIKDREKIMRGDFNALFNSSKRMPDKTDNNKT